MKPSALVIGPMKAGTTWIHEYLAWRGDVTLPSGLKETFFFDRHFERGTEWYENFFNRPESGETLATVEVAPSLFHSESAPDRVRQVLGSVPLIVATREPASRSWSHYAHMRRKGYTQAPLEKAVIEFPEILSASNYQFQIARWQKTLPDAKISILDLDVLKNDPDSYTKSLCEVLNLPLMIPETQMGQANASGTPKSFWFAKVSRRSSELLRSIGAHSLVNAGKRLGLKKLAYGTDSGKGLKASQEDMEFLADALKRQASDEMVSNDGLIAGS